MTVIDLKGVALRTHDAPYLFDMDPFAHQKEMRHLIQGRDRFIAVNDSPTGGGKTSSWLAPALEEKRNTIAIYPTNALITDQKEAIQKQIEETVEHDVTVVMATADRLAEVSKRFNANSHGAVLDAWLRQERRQTEQQILLTNPDIFVMLRRDLYRKPNREYKNFELAVVDEFHRAGRKEQNTLRYLLDEMQSEDDAVVALRQVAFLSATPDSRQERLFEDAMEAPYHCVTKKSQSERKSFIDFSNADWHPVMPPVELEIRTAPTFGTADKIIAAEDETVSFCRGGRTIVMLDGIHEVNRVYTWLQDKIDAQVERIDGFYSENKEEKLQRFDVLVSNSAVEVGIDFDVDRILFAGHNRDSFLQRLGRLRSEAEWQKARCYVPKSIARALSEYNKETLSRTTLGTVLEGIYPEPRQPETFDARYSAAEAFEHLDHRLRNAPSEDQQTIKRSSLNRIEKHFGVGTDTEFSLRDMEAFTETLDWRVLTALQWYRGDSVQALVYDQTDNRIITYDLFYLLRYGDVEFFDKQTFEKIVDTEYVDEISRHERYVDGFCTYRGTIETNDEGYGRNVYFTGGVLHEWLDSTTDTGRKPQMKSGLTIDVDPNETGSRVPSVSKVNDRLRDRGKRSNEDDGGLLCYPVSGYPNQLKRQYNLGEFFFLYPIRVQNKDTHSLATGTDALYLHCHVLEQNSKLTDNGEDGFIGDI